MIGACAAYVGTFLHVAALLTAVAFALPITSPRRTEPR